MTPVRGMVFSGLVTLGACGGWSDGGRGGDEALLFMAEDLVRVKPDLKLDDANGHFDRIDGGSGSFKLSYEYRNKNGEKPLFIGSYVFIRPDAEAAQTAYHTALVGANVGDSGMATRPRPDLMQWGEERECVDLMAREKPVGQRCIARKDRVVVMVNVAGIAPFEGPGSVDAALAPQLALMEAK